MQKHASSHARCRRLAASHFGKQAFWPLPMAPALQVALPVAGAQHLESMLPARYGQPPVERALQLMHCVMGAGGLGPQVLQLPRAAALHQVASLLDLPGRRYSCCTMQCLSPLQELQ